MNPSTTEYTFDAFISYSHRDLYWGQWLQRKLETFHIPNDMRGDRPKGQRLRIFRDQTDLAGTELNSSLRQNLDASRYLIVLCSPSSAASSWVNEEVLYFISAGRVDRIIPFIVDGEPLSDDSSLECFPPALRDLEGHVLLGANIQEIGKSKVFLKVVSILLGVRFGRLVDREKQRKIRTALITGITTAVIASVGGILLWRNYVVTQKNHQLSYDIYGAALVSIAQKDTVEPEDIAFLRTSAEEGNTMAIVLLADFCKNGDGMDAPDYDQEFYWSKKGADLGSSLCMVSLANCYFNGEGTEKDYQKAFEWDMKAAELDNPTGMLNVAIFFEDGRGVRKDPKTAFDWYKKCAEADLEKVPLWQRDNEEESIKLGIYNLARCYATGTGVEENKEQAFSWMEKLAGMGNSFGMYNLAVSYQYGYGTKEDPEKAYYWYRKAADTGDADSAYMVGWCLENKFGVENPSLEWYEKAAALGNEKAKEALENPEK